MSQSWDTIEATEKLKDTRSEINNNFATLRSNFSGTDFPTSPVAGQLFFRTTDYSIWIYDGSSWWQIGTASEHFLSLLPRSGGDSYPMTGNLNLGGNRAVNAGDPVNSSDLVTLNYLDSVVDSHTHDGTSGEGPKIDVTNLNGRARGVDSSSGTVSVYGETELCSKTLTVIASEPKIIMVSAQYVFGAAVPSTKAFAVRRDSTTLVDATLPYWGLKDDSGNSTYRGILNWTVIDTPSAGTYTYKFIVNTNVSSDFSYYWILVF